MLKLATDANIDYDIAVALDRISINALTDCRYILASPQRFQSLSKEIRIESQVQNYWLLVENSQL